MLYTDTILKFNGMGECNDISPYHKLRVGSCDIHSTKNIDAIGETRNLKDESIPLVPLSGAPSPAALEPTHQN